MKPPTRCSHCRKRSVRASSLLMRFGHDDAADCMCYQRMNGVLMTDGVGDAPPGGVLLIPGRRSSRRRGSSGSELEGRGSGRQRGRHGESERRPRNMRIVNVALHSICCASLGCVCDHRTMERVCFCSSDRGRSFDEAEHWSDRWKGWSKRTKSMRQTRLQRRRQDRRWEATNDGRPAEEDGSEGEDATERNGEGHNKTIKQGNGADNGC